MGPIQVLPIGVRVNLGVMAMKGYSILPRSSSYFSSASYPPHPFGFFCGGGLTSLLEIQSQYCKHCQTGHMGSWAVYSLCVYVCVYIYIYIYTHTLVHTKKY